IPHAARTVRGTNSISRTSLRVRNDSALQYWIERFKTYHISYRQIDEEAGRKIVHFTNFEQQRLALISDEHNQSNFSGEPIPHPEIPPEYAIIGLGSVTLTVKDCEATINCLTEVLKFKKEAEYNDINNGHLTHIFSVDNG